MKDVAREANVSEGTVSKVFIGIPVGESYRNSVEEAAKRLDYEVNTYARGLRAGRTYTVALILPNLKNPFFAVIAHEICKALNMEGYRMTVHITDFDAEAEQRMIRMAYQNKVDGIIAITCSPNLVLDADVPFVSINRNLNPTIPCVSSDDFGGGFLAAEKLVSLGCKRLVYFGGGHRVFEGADGRLDGFLACCKSKGVFYDVLCSESGNHLEQSKEYVQLHTAEGRPDFDGVFCDTDRLAIEIQAIMADFGIRVPEHVQIIGFDGVRAFGDGRFVCSTIVQPIQLIAETCVSALLKKGKSSIPSQICLPVIYAPGGTTREPYDSVM